MKYRIFVISYSEYCHDIELHNLEREANPTNLCFMKIKENIELYDFALGLADQLSIVLGRDCCDIVEASGTK